MDGRDQTPGLTATNAPGIKSIEVGGRLLTALADMPRATPLSRLAAAAAMPPTKARRYLVSFKRLGLVVQHPESGFYDLGPLAFRMGLAAIGRLDIVSQAGAFLRRVRDETGETVTLAVWSGTAPTVVALEDSRTPVALIARIGVPLPLLTTATGLVFAAFLPPEDGADGIAAACRALTADQLAAVLGQDEDLDAFLRRIRRIGYVGVEGIFQPGINGLSAPIFDFRGRLAASMTVLSLSLSTAPDAEQKLSALLREAKLLSAALGFDGKAAREAAAAGV